MKWNNTEQTTFFPEMAFLKNNIYKKHSVDNKTELVFVLKILLWLKKK